MSASPSSDGRSSNQANIELATATFSQPDERRKERKKTHVFVSNSKHEVATFEVDFSDPRPVNKKEHFASIV